jgi:hypothetical protein
MAPPSDRRLRALVLTAGLLVTALAPVNLERSARAGYTDALFEPDYSIRQAPPAGPLAEAGFREGDRVVSVEGVPVDELGMYSRWPRSLRRAPGEVLEMTVERGGELIRGRVVYREVPAAVVHQQVVGTLIILSFLWAGVLAFLSVGTPPSLRLALTGFALSLSVMGVPSSSWSGVVGHLQVAGAVLGTLFLARFFLHFPTRKRLATIPYATGAIYGAWLFLLGCLALELVLHPRLYHTFGSFIALLMVGYVLLAVGAAIHTAVTLPAAELWASGMGIVLAFSAAAAALVLVAILDWSLPSVTVPGSSWLGLAVGLIPVGMGLGVRKQARCGESRASG